MREYRHEWQKPFDLCGFHFSSIMQAEVVLLFLEYHGNVKRIAAQMGNMSCVPIETKLRRFRMDNGMENSTHMAMCLVGHMGFWNELEGYLGLNRNLLAKAKQRAELGRQALIKRRKNHE